MSAQFKVMDTADSQVFSPEMQAHKKDLIRQIESHFTPEDRQIYNKAGVACPVTLCEAFNSFEAYEDYIKASGDKRKASTTPGSLKDRLGFHTEATVAQVYASLRSYAAAARLSA